jgi:hypothetical protein
VTILLGEEGLHVPDEGAGDGGREVRAASSSALPLHRKKIIQPTILFAVKLQGRAEAGRALFKIDPADF